MLSKLADLIHILKIFFFFLNFSNFSQYVAKFSMPASDNTYGGDANHVFRYKI